MTALAVEQPPPHLSPRETQVRERLERGMTVLEIAADLRMSKASVEFQRWRVRKKLGLAFVTRARNTMRTNVMEVFETAEDVRARVDRDVLVGLRCPVCLLWFEGLDCKPGDCRARKDAMDQLDALVALWTAVHNWRDAKWVHKPHRKRSADGDE